MKVIRCKNYEEMSQKAAEIVEAAVAAKPKLVLGLATGSTPEGFYAALVRDYQAGKVDFSGVTTVNLDEYCNLPRDHEQSYYTFMHKNLFDHVNIPADRTFLPNGEAKDLQAEAARYEKLVASLGYADVQILGVGQNGHIGFNEPAAEMPVDTHVTALTANTIRANSRFFPSENDVPKYALTMGLGTIFSARHIILMASGANKRDAITHLLNGTAVETSWPVTLLKLHQNVTVICDEAALPQ